MMIHYFMGKIIKCMSRVKEKSYEKKLYGSMIHKINAIFFFFLLIFIYTKSTHIGILKIKVLELFHQFLLLTLFF